MVGSSKWAGNLKRLGVTKFSPAKCCQGLDDVPVVVAAWARRPHERLDGRVRRRGAARPAADVPHVVMSLSLQIQRNIGRQQRIFSNNAGKVVQSEHVLWEVAKNMTSEG